MKVKICPICGGTRLDVVQDWDGERKLHDECLDCGKEIIPLVTPQEIDND